MLDTDTRAVLANLGANIARLRKRAAKTQAQLAEGVDCETSYLQALEYGSKAPSLPMLVRIARQLGVKLGVLFRDAKPIRGKRGRPKAKKRVSVTRRSAAS